MNIAILVSFARKIMVSAVTDNAADILTAKATKDVVAENAFLFASMYMRR